MRKASHLFHWKPEFENFCIALEDVQRSPDLDKMEAGVFGRFGLKHEALVAEVVLEHLTTAHRPRMRRHLGTIL